MIGDDDRRQKSKPHREAAKSRWEGMPNTIVRRLFEGMIDGLNWLLVMLTRVLLRVVTLNGRLSRGGSNSRGRSGRQLRRRD
jgi:hypothetical protein